MGGVRGFCLGTTLSNLLQDADISKNTAVGVSWGRGCHSPRCEIKTAWAEPAGCGGESRKQPARSLLQSLYVHSFSAGSCRLGSIERRGSRGLLSCCSAAFGMAGLLPLPHRCLPLSRPSCDLPKRIFTKPGKNDPLGGWLPVNEGWVLAQRTTSLLLPLLLCTQPGGQRARFTGRHGKIKLDPQDGFLLLCDQSRNRATGVRRAVTATASRPSVHILYLTALPWERRYLHHLDSSLGSGQQIHKYSASGDSEMLWCRKNAS